MALKTIDDLTRDWERLRAQKSRKTGGIEGRTLVNIGFVLGEQYIAHRESGIHAEQQETNKLYLVFNLIKPRFNKLLGRLTAGSMNFVANPNKEDAQSLADKVIVTALDKALDQKLSQPTRLWELLWWCGIGGTAVVHTPWVPDAITESVPIVADDGTPMWRAKNKPDQLLPEPVVAAMVEAGAPVEMFELAEEVQTTGEVGCEVYGPLNVFIDQGCRSIEDLSPDQMVYIATVRTLGWVERNFKKKVKPSKSIDIVATSFHQTGSSVGGYFLRDLIPMIQGASDQSNVEGEGVVTVVQGYGPPSPEHPRGRYVCFIPGDTILHDKENPYEEIPLVDFHWQPVTTSFWTADYVTDLIAPQRFTNKRLSQLGEQANASVYSQLLLGPGLTATDIPADFPGAVKNGLNEAGNPNVRRLDGPNLPPWFMPATQQVIEMFNDIAGAGDLFKESKFPGQLRGSEAVPMLQEILDTEWGPLFEHIGERMSRVKQQRLNRVKRFYEPHRTLHYVGKDNKDEILEFHKEAVLSRGVNYSFSVERSSLLPELKSVREFRLVQRLNSPLAALYVDKRTGQLDTEKIAQELQFGETGRGGRDDQYRKLAKQIVELIWKVQQPPQPLPFWNHRVMLDELEAEMSTLEYLRASQQVQQLFIAQYEAHRAYLVQEAQQQQQAAQQGAVQNAVAMATQQAAAQAAAMAVEQAMAVSVANRAAPTDQIVAGAVGATGAGVEPRSGGPVI